MDRRGPPPSSSSSSFIALGIFRTITSFRARPSGGARRGELGASPSYKRAQVARSYWGSGEAEEGQGAPLARTRTVRTAGKWVPTSELAPLVPLVGSSSFAENSIIMIAYDVNDAPRQQLFPPERARGGCGPRHRRPVQPDKATGRPTLAHGDEFSNRGLDSERVGRCDGSLKAPFSYRDIHARIISPGTGCRNIPMLADDIATRIIFEVRGLQRATRIVPRSNASSGKQLHERLRIIPG